MNSRKKDFFLIIVNCLLEMYKTGLRVSIICYTRSNTHCYFNYSYLNASTGFLRDAFTILNPTVIIARRKVIPVAKTKT